MISFLETDLRMSFSAASTGIYDSQTSPLLLPYVLCKAGDWWDMVTHTAKSMGNVEVVSFRLAVQSLPSYDSC